MWHTILGGTKLNNDLPVLGPTNARILLIGDYARLNEVTDGLFSRGAGTYLNKALQKSGLQRSDIRITALLRRPTNYERAENLEQFRTSLLEEIEQCQPDLILVTGTLPRDGGGALKVLCGVNDISKWHGSLLHPEHWPLVDLHDNTGKKVADANPFLRHLRCPVMPIVDPHTIAETHNFPLVWDLQRDLQRAKRYLDGKWSWEYEDRKWYLGPGNIKEFEMFVERIERAGHFFAVDSESEPYWILSFADEHEVHSFGWEERFRPLVQRLLGSESILKAAHNLNHDWTFFTKRLGIQCSYPFVDTMGVSHILDPESRKALSPGASTRFTSWPYHKWMYYQDPIAYCGIDTACCADIYWGQLAFSQAEGSNILWAGPIQRDHQLQDVLLKMQWEGVRIDEDNRAKVEVQLSTDLLEEEKLVEEMAEPIILDRIDSFRKPHLFRGDKACTCCGGGSSQRKQCFQCSGLGDRPGKITKSSYAGLYSDGKKYTISQAKERMTLCTKCVANAKGRGRVEHWEPLNVGSTTQMSDVIYRGLGIRPRILMGKETLRYDRLEGIKDKHPFIVQYIKQQKVRADFKTVERLRPGPDGRLHCIFDPFGTTSGRVACKEGLLEAGTNLMNVPYKARALIVPNPGDFIIYPDMAQVEARCVAVLSQDPKLLEIYADSKKDSHMEVLYAVREATGFDFNEVNQGPHAGHGRFFAKKATYAYMYGIRANHFSGELGISVELAQRILDGMEQTFTGIKQWREDTEQEIYQTRRVTTDFTAGGTRHVGHRRRFLERTLDRKTGGLDYEILKKGLSHKPQDMGAYILGSGLLRITADHSDLLRPLIHVHDALLLTASLDRKIEAMEAAKAAMSFKLWGMDFPAGISAGPDWFCASLPDTAGPKEPSKITEGYGEWTEEAILNESTVSV